MSKDNENFGCFMLLMPFALAWPFVVAYVLWCGWGWHALALGAPEVGYRTFAAGCVGLMVLRAGKVSNEEYKPQQFMGAMGGAYFTALFAFVTLWVLGGAP